VIDFKMNLGRRVVISLPLRHACDIFVIKGDFGSDDLNLTRD